MSSSNRDTNSDGDGIQSRNTASQEPKAKRRLAPEAYERLHKRSVLRTKGWPREFCEEVISEATRRCHDDDYHIVLHYRMEKYGTPEYDAGRKCIDKNARSAYDFVSQRYRTLRKEGDIQLIEEQQAPASDSALIMDVADAIAKLPNDEQQVITLLMQEIPATEIAVRLNRSYEWVRWTYRKATARLQYSLRTYADPSD
jgi:hypothetical protein